MTNTILSQERTPQGGYSTQRITVANGTLSPATDPLAKLNTQELEAVAAQLDADTAAKQAYWTRHTRTHEEV